MYKLAFGLVLLLLLVVAIYLYLTWHHRYWEKRGLITAKPLSILGSYPSLLTRKSNLVHDVQKVYDKYKGKHRAVGVFMTRQPQILVLDPELAHEVLVLNFRCYRDSLTSSYIPYTKRDKYAKRNPFFASGDIWRRSRNEVQAGVSIRRLYEAYAIWEESGKKLNQYMADQILKNNNQLETRDLCLRYTAHVMADFIWGIDAGTLTCPRKTANEFQHMASKWTNYTFYMLTIFMATFIAPFCRLLLGFRLYSKDTDKFFSNVTKMAIDLRLKTEDQESRTDYLSYLLQLQEQKQSSHDDLVGHALTVLLDGYDTTGTALLHALYYLADNPAAQQKLRTEVLENLNTDRSLSFQQLCDLPYLEQVVYESLRLSSLIPQYTKICTSPTFIQLNELKTFEVEEGMTIMIPNYQFHHDEQYFPDAETFRPERFENGAYSELVKKGVFLPFSDGPRICIGMRLAELTLKSALLQIVSNYQIIRSKEKIRASGDSGFGITLQGDIYLDYRLLR